MKLSNMRKKSVLKIITRKLENGKKPSPESSKSLVEEINGFKVVFIKTGVAAEDFNALMKNHPLNKEAIFKIQPTSKDFYHTRNFDSSMLVLLNFQVI